MCLAGGRRDATVVVLVLPSGRGRLLPWPCGAVYSSRIECRCRDAQIAELSRKIPSDSQGRSTSSHGWRSLNAVVPLTCEPEKPGQVRIIAEHRPALAFYLAGADPYEQDQLGGLGLSLDGLRRRDGLVFEVLGKAGVPVGVVTAGGYAMDPRDTVEIHANTVREAGTWGAGSQACS